MKIQASVQISEFFLSQAIPTSLYEKKPFYASDIGLKISWSIKEEIERLLQDFLNAFHFHGKGVFLRLDLFVDPDLERVHLLEINSRFVDGWGAALLLSGTTSTNINFPKFWHIPQNNWIYAKEFDLTLAEIKKLGKEIMELEDLSQVKNEEIYYYAWDRPREKNLIVPAMGYEIENKIHLTKFSHQWQGEQVQIPLGYSTDETPWEKIPTEGVLFKFCEKGSPDSQRAKTNVLYPREIGKGKFARQCYERGTLIAQDIISPLEYEGKISQLVLLTAGNEVVTGYVVWAPRGTRVITDAYEHAPIIWG